MTAALEGAECLVLGAGGFIGSHLCQALVRAGARVRGFGRAPAFADSLPPLPFTQGEFTDGKALAPAVQGAEIVFHMLGGTTPEASNRNPVVELQANTLASLHLLELCRDTGVRKIVFVSSGGAIYGVSPAVPITEDAPTNPVSAYGINKLMVEKYLQLYTRLGGAHGVSLRVANPYGQFQSPFRGQGLVPALIQTVLAGRPVEIWGDGQVVRDFLYAGDVADAMLAAAVYDGPSPVFNIGSGVGRSVLEVLDSVCAMLGRRPPEVIFKASRPADVPKSVLDITRAKTELGWAPRTAWQDGLARTAEWVRGAFPGER